MSFIGPLTLYEQNEKDSVRGEQRPCLCCALVPWLQRYLCIQSTSIGWKKQPEPCNRSGCLCIVALLLTPPSETASLTIPFHGCRQLRTFPLVLHHHLYSDMLSISC